MANTEVEFAACLLSCGGPDRLRPAGHFNHEPLTTRDFQGRMGFPITSADYMFKVAHWYDKTIEPFMPEGHYNGDSIEFTAWWVKYKGWLVENWNG